MAPLQLKLALHEVDEDGRHRAWIVVPDTAAWPRRSLHPRLYVRCDVDHEGQDDVSLGGEVVIDRPLADVRGGGNLVDRDRVDAVVAEQPDRRFDDHLTGRRFLARAPPVNPQL